MRNAVELWTGATDDPTDDQSDAPSENRADARFADDSWAKFPFNVWSQAHRQNWQWWQDAMTGVHGVAPPHEDLMAFVAGLAVDTAAPSNFAFTNPQIIKATLAEKGQNLLRGARHLSKDRAARLARQPITVLRHSRLDAISRFRSE